MNTVQTTRRVRKQAPIRPTKSNSDQYSLHVHKDNIPHLVRLDHTS